TQRIITGVIGGAIVIGAIAFSEYTFLLLLLLISILGLLEFYKLCEGDGIQPQKVFGTVIAVIIFLPFILSSAFNIIFDIHPLFFILPSVVFIRELYTKSEK